MSEDDLVRFAAILDEFTAAQRRAALGEARKQRITIVRNIGQICQVTYETVIDEGASGEEIFALLAPIDQALDRLKAKSDLSDQYNLALNDCGEIEVASKKLAAMRVEYDATNTQHNASRRTARVGLTSQQVGSLNEQRKSINTFFERIEERKRVAAECLSVLQGSDPFDLLRQKLDDRVDALRGSREAA